MNSSPSALFLSLFAPFYFPAILFYHLMVFKVNRHLPEDDRIPHALYLGDCNRLAREYKFDYPKSALYAWILCCALSIFGLALAVFAYRFWELAAHK